MKKEGKSKTDVQGTRSIFFFNYTGPAEIYTLSLHGALPFYADRCCFVDGRGKSVPADLMTALLARDYLTRTPGAAIVYDLRSSWVVKQVIAEGGGEPIRDRVGHSFIKATMRERGALFAGELSGHFYFKDNFVCDSGVIAMVSAINLLGRQANAGKSLADLVEDLRRYYSTGELNFRVQDKAAAIAELKSAYAQGEQDELDGITVEFGGPGDEIGRASCRERV